MCVTNSADFLTFQDVSAYLFLPRSERADEVHRRARPPGRSAKNVRYLEWVRTMALKWALPFATAPAPFVGASFSIAPV